MVFIDLAKTLAWFECIKEDLNRDELGELLPMIFNNTSDLKRKELMGYIDHNYPEYLSLK